MAITNTQINNAIPEYGDTTPHPTQPNQALMNQLLKTVRDEKADTASLGTAATKNVGTAVGNVVGVGAFGLGDAGESSANFDTGFPSGFYRSNQQPNSLSSSYWAGLHTNYGGIGIKRGFTVYIDNFQYSNAQLKYVHEFDESRYQKTLLDTGNTTVDSNGFIKEASPIVKLHSDHIEKNGDFAASFEKIDTGHYLIKNTLGLAQDGWYIETPKDANGNIQVFVEYEDTDGDITVKTYEPDYSTGRVTAGVPADIPEGRWIDIRLHELPPEPETKEAPIEDEQ